MRKLFFKCVVFGLAATVLQSEAALNAELIMPGGRSWKGSVLGRDGDWVSFSTGPDTNPIRVGAGTITEFVFDVNVDEEKLNQMNRDREYARIIDALTRTLEPYAEYDDVPSNLTTFKALLMELHYKTGDFENALKMAENVVKDERDPDLQERGRVYMALSLIDSGRAAEAEKLLVEFGWDGEFEKGAAPEKLYITAKLLALKKEYPAAMEMVARIVAFNSQNPDWMQPAELLCAQIYTELGASNPIMYDSAEEVIRQISLLYPNTNEDDEAQKLKIRLEQLRSELEIEQSDDV